MNIEVWYFHIKDGRLCVYLSQTTQLKTQQILRAETSKRLKGVMGDDIEEDIEDLLSILTRYN